jgi:hypothetical protein
MSTYINVKTKEYPLHTGDIQLVDSEVFFEKTGECSNTTFSLIVESPFPNLELDEVAYELPPEEVNGTWTQIWGVRKMATEELAKVAKNYERVSTEIEVPSYNEDTSDTPPEIIEETGTF